MNKEGNTKILRLWPEFTYYYNIFQGCQHFITLEQQEKKASINSKQFIEYLGIY